ncbi:hypothetical protein [Paenibacillus sp. FSL R5-0912]|uniref:hypothetical protein n=1 Tax=Paenibacillus sp. FSL R5-0912 TaxID=1536771 RepID=UPI0018CFDB59|nr:hypothetical protein [Paenibacillus sp. FSL R5-0912]
MVNYGLTGLAVLFLAALLLSWRKNRSASTARGKWSAILPIVMMVVLVGLLVFWQFYS